MGTNILRKIKIFKIPVADRDAYQKNLIFYCEKLESSKVKPDIFLCPGPQSFFFITHFLQFTMSFAETLDEC